LAYLIRFMRQEDVALVNEIDRETFPTHFPPLDYKRELQAQYTHHIVVCETAKEGQTPEIKTPPERGFAKLTSRIRQFFGEKPSPVSSQKILGFASLRVIADEAHLTNIAVRQAYRGQGLGELLLISVIELASTLKADFIALEVRASNLPAQNLYKKYGFAEVGLRHGYYTDNREDAVVMSTESLSSPTFQKRLWRLKQAHAHKYGGANIKLDAHHTEIV